MVTEIWKPIDGYLDYEVSNLGNVFSVKRKILLSKSLNTNGYLKVRLFLNGKGKTFPVHKIVQRAFLESTNGFVVNHIDHNKQNNSLSNLEVISQRENIKHSKARNNYSSKHVGVARFKRNKKWGATIFVNGKNRFLGLFENENDAKKAYDDYLLTLN